MPLFLFRHREGADVRMGIEMGNHRRAEAIWHVNEILDADGFQSLDYGPARFLPIIQCQPRAGRLSGTCLRTCLEVGRRQLRTKIGKEWGEPCKPVSRVLCPLAADGDHLSSPPRKPKLPGHPYENGTASPPGSSGQPGDGPDTHSPPTWPCSRWGLAAAASPQTAGRSYRPISPLSARCSPPE